MRENLIHQWTFLKRYLKNPTTIGAVAPSSRALAAALCEPFLRGRKPASVLEVGAGTGAITRYLGHQLGPLDQLDVCEVQEEFADVLERDVLSMECFQLPAAEGRLHLLRCPVQSLPGEGRYDFVISGLPLTSFGLRDVREVLSVIRRCLKPGGVFSYFEYIGLRRISRALMLGRGRNRIRLVSAYLNRNIQRHQYQVRTVLTNLPPAYARHWRFDR